MNTAYPVKTLLLRHKFFTHRQVEGQSFDEFVTSLRKLSADCEFGELTSSLIRDIIVVGVTSNQLREQMLREPNLSLEQAIRLGQSAEEAQKHVKALRQEAEISKISHTFKPSPHTYSNSFPSSSNPRRATPFNNNSTLIRKCKFCNGTQQGQLSSV